MSLDPQRVLRPPEPPKEALMVTSPEGAWRLGWASAWLEACNVTAAHEFERVVRVEELHKQMESNNGLLQEAVRHTVTVIEAIIRAGLTPAELVGGGERAIAVMQAILNVQVVGDPNGPPS